MEINGNESLKKQQQYSQLVPVVNLGLPRIDFCRSIRKKLYQQKLMCDLFHHCIMTP